MDEFKKGYHITKKVNYITYKKWFKTQNRT